MSLEILVSCIQAFAAEESNPLLATLPANSVVETDTRYPVDRYRFDGLGMNAYYHCHGANNRPEQEHGHFHLFLQSGNKWSHLAALSMDQQGQPLQWFSVNLWVTGEAWGETADLLEQLDRIPCEPALSLTEQWLLAMAHFYRPVLQQLLEQRDQQIEALACGRDLATVQQDRQIYTLSSREIKLLEDIQQAAGLV